MRSVAAFAKGLMQLLGSTAESGRGLTALDDAMRCTVDAERFLGANRRINGYFPLTDLVVGNNVCATVPRGKIWIVRAGGCLVDTPAATAIRFQPRIRTPASNVSTVMGDMLLTVASSTDSIPLAFQNFILEAGTEIIIYVPTKSSATASPASFTLLVEEVEA